MRKNYDFSNAVKNPHAGKFKNGYAITIEHKDYDEIITMTKIIRKKENTDKNNTNYTESVPDEFAKVSEDIKEYKQS